MSICKHRPCIGWFNGRKCPYNSRDEVKQTCGIHCDKLVYFSKKIPVKVISPTVSCVIKSSEEIKPPVVSWVLSSNKKKTKTYSVCDICSNIEYVRNFECDIHQYCDKCLIKASESDSCPICLSIQ